MTKEAICTGKSVEEALEAAYTQLGVTSDEADFEILERPKRSLFGLRVTPAKVRVYAEIPEEKKPAPQPPRQNVAKPQQSERPRPAPVPAPAPPKQTKPEPPAPPKPAAEPPAPPKEVTEESHAKVECAKEYLLCIFRDMGLEQVEVGVKETGSGVVFTLSGEGLGVLIGRRGETLDALQYLSGLVANRLAGDYFRITIDSGNYREKREHTLEQLARKLSAQVVKTGRNMTLEPMNPYERRIIHATVQNIEGVTSSSIGEEPNRRVVISSPNARRRSGPPRSSAPREGTPHEGGAPRSDGYKGGPRPGGPSRGGRGGRPRTDRDTGPANITTRPNAFGNAPTGEPRPADISRPAGGARPGGEFRPSSGPRGGGFRSGNGPRPAGGPRPAESSRPGGHIDDSAYEIEPPVRSPRPTTDLRPEGSASTAPKAPVPPEVTGKPLYSKIDLDD